MTTRDSLGLVLSGAGPAHAAGYDAYVEEYLSYGAGLRDFFAIADDAPGAAFLNAHAAALHLAFEGAEGWAAAAPYLARMRGATADLETDRERLFCRAVEAWAARDFHVALDLLDELTVRWPADICAIKWGQYHAFNLGRPDALLRFGTRARIVHEDRPYAHGMIAFALEQNHRLDEAEEEGRRACEIAIDDAWAHHAVAHVLDARGEARKGARWLDRCAHAWERKGVFIRDHNWWHAALFRLYLGETDEALAIYDDRLWGVWPEFPQEQIGAVSMLWRLEMCGCDVGDRWAPVAAQARQRAGEHLFAFHDLHYLYALARHGARCGGGDRQGDSAAADAMLRSMKERANALDGPARLTWAEALLPAAEAALAFARDDYACAAQGFTRAAPGLARIGGSHAQRQLFADALAYASVRASDPTSAPLASMGDAR